MEKQKKRLTTDDPQNNIETMLNYCYAKDGCVTIRGMENQSFMAYLRGECRARGCDLFDMDDAETMDCIMECAFSAPECPIFMLYIAASQAAELRHRLKAYEDTGVEPNDVLTGAEMAKVAMALQELKSRKDAEATGGWTSVKNGLPADDEIVLVTYLQYSDGTPACDMTAKYSIAANGYNGGWVDTYDDEPVLIPITHWQPLPKPPKGGRHR